MSSKFLLLSVLSLASFAFPGVAQVIPCIEIRCPTNIAVPCQSSAGSPVAFSVTATNNCGSIVNVSCVPSSGSTFPPGTTIVNCTGSGPNQNGAIQTNRCTFTVTVAGNCPSNCITIKCPSNLVVQCVVPPRATTIGQFQLFGGSVLDTCSTNLTLLSSDSPLTSLCGGTITRVYTVIDGLSNAASCTQTITVSDTIPPVLVGIPGNTNLQCFTLLPPINVTATDNCDTNVIITFTSTTNGVCPTVIVRTWTARDRCTNTTSASQTILVQDTIPPVLFGVPGNTNLPCIPFLPPAFVTATDNCDGTNLAVQVTVTTNGTCPRTIIRTWTARDRCTNSVSATQVITVSDTIPPLITCPSNLFVQCLSDIPPCGTNIAQFRAMGGIATDNCGSNLLYFCSDAAIGNGGGLSPCFATITRTHTVMDACSNAASCQQTIVVRDTIPPVIICPADITIETCSNRQVFFQVSATDNCDPNVTATCVPSSGSLFGPGVTTVTCQAMDRCSNRGSCTFTVTAHCTSNSCLTITNITTRQIECVSNNSFHASLEIKNLTAGPVSYVAFTDLPPGVTLSPDLVALPAPLPPGASTIVNVTVVLPANSPAVLTSICFRVSIHNANFIECCAVPYCIPIPTCCMEITGDSLICTNLGLTYSFDLRNLSGVPVRYVFLAPEPDCFDVAPDVITLAPPLPSGASRHFTVSLQNVQTTCGPNLCLRIVILDSNMVQCCSILHCVPNPGIPRIQCPSNIVAQCQSSAGTIVNYDAHASGVCGSNQPVNCFPPSGAMFPPGTTTVHCQTPGSNSTERCDFTVTVIGNCGPCIELRCPSNVLAQCTSPAGAIVGYSIFVTNPCTGIINGFSCFPPSGSQFPIGATIVTCTAVAQGQTNRCQFPVLVTGGCGSNCVEIICPSNRVMQCSGMTMGTRVDYFPAVVNQCGTNIIATCVPPSGSFFPVGTTVVNCQAGLPGTVPARCSFTITILAGPPCNMDNCIELRCPSNITAICTTPLGAPVTYSVFATNRCSTDLVVSCIPASGSTFPPGITTVHCAAFGNGNNFSNLCNFTVSVIGNCPVPSPLGLIVARDGDFVELMLQSIEGVTSQIEYSDSSGSPEWRLFRTITGDGSVIVITDSVNAASQRFYRLRLDP